MIAFRTMTYAINGGRGIDGCLDVERIADVIYDADPDIVALQGVTQEALEAGLSNLPEQLNMAAFGLNDPMGLALLSRTPLRGYAAFDLNHGGRCQCADYHLHDRLVHLFNLSLSFHPLHRRDQLEALQGEEIFRHPRLSSALVVHGDFSLPMPCPGLIGFHQQFKRARYPRWRRTYPSRLPVCGRSRIYLQGPIEEIAGRIPKTGLVRKASTSLPLIETLQIVDTRTPLRAPEIDAPKLKPIGGQSVGCG